MRLKLIRLSVDMPARRWPISSPLPYVFSILMSSQVYGVTYWYIQNRFHTWRKLWLNLAIAEKQLGLPISDQAVEEMKANLVRTDVIYRRTVQC